MKVVIKFRLSLTELEEAPLNLVSNFAITFEFPKFTIES